MTYKARNEETVTHMTLTATATRDCYSTGRESRRRGRCALRYHAVQGVSPWHPLEVKRSSLLPPSTRRRWNDSHNFRKELALSGIKRSKRPLLTPWMTIGSCIY